MGASQQNIPCFTLACSMAQYTMYTFCIFRINLSLKWTLRDMQETCLKQHQIACIFRRGRGRGVASGVTDWCGAFRSILFGGRLKLTIFPISGQNNE